MVTTNYKRDDTTFVEEITRKTDIESLVKEYVDLNPVGVQSKGEFPFCHSTSFIVPANKQIYKCFKCGKGGEAVSFVQEIEKRHFLRLFIS